MSTLDYSSLNAFATTSEYTWQV